MTPADPSAADATGGIFGITSADMNSLPLSIRLTMVQNGGQLISVVPTPDEVPPVTTAFLSGTQGLNGWYTSPVQVTLLAADTDGPDDIASTTYTVDGGSPITYSAAFNIPNDGVHTITFGSLDQAGNVETPRRSQVISVTNPAGEPGQLPVEGSTSGNSSATVAAGSSASYNLQVTPVNGFTGTLSLSCSGCRPGPHVVLRR